MLKSHLDAVEAQLLAISKIPANAGHTLHRGTPREAFIRTFLEGHLSARLAVGTGEIISASSKPRDPRNQFDIIIYKAEYPRIALGGGINAFLAESVVATIEVKSVLTEADLETATASSSTVKRLERNIVSAFRTGYVPAGILSYLIAYEGPANAATVLTWLRRVEAKQGLNQTVLPPTSLERIELVSDGLDGVFCLGKHSVLFDTSPITLVTDSVRAGLPDGKRVMCEGADGNLMHFFLALTYAGANLTAQWPDLAKYLDRIEMPYTFAT